MKEPSESVSYAARLAHGVLKAYIESKDLSPKDYDVATTLEVRSGPTTVSRIMAPFEVCDLLVALATVGWPSDVPIGVS